MYRNYTSIIIKSEFLYNLGIGKRLMMIPKSGSEIYLKSIIFTDVFLSLSLN